MEPSQNRSVFTALRLHRAPASPRSSLTALRLRRRVYCGVGEISTSSLSRADDRFKGSSRCTLPKLS